MSTLRVTILGSGSSGGVPRADGDWGACDPSEPRNRRTRCSLLVQRYDGAFDAARATSVLIDTSPELRQQTAAAGMKRLDAVLYSHDHADQAHGIDDVRAFALRQRKRIPVYLDAPTRRTLTRRFSYCFYGEGGYPPILQAMPDIAAGAPFTVDGPGGPVPFLPILQDHGGGAVSLGFRIGAFGYSNDVVHLNDAAFEALAGVRVWVVDALRYTPHPTHAHLERALAWIARLGPERAILTNLHVDLDYARLAQETPAEVEPAYDGLSIDILEAFQPNADDYCP